MGQVKCGRAPGACVVAGGTVRAKRPGVESWVGMATDTSGGRPHKICILMACLAGNAQMSANQREFGFVVVERIIVPARGLVTQIAFLTESTLVLVILLVAGKTFRRRSLWIIGRVTILAGDINVLAFQFERGQVVVERGGSPRVQRVTLGTVRAEAALMRIILLVTGETIPRGGLQICQ